MDSPPKKRLRTNTRRPKSVVFPNHPVASIREYNINNNTRRIAITPGHRARTRRVVGPMNNRNRLQTSMKNLHQAISQLLAEVHERNETPKNMIDDIDLMPTDQMLKDYLVAKLLQKYKYTEQNFTNFANNKNNL